MEQQEKHDRMVAAMKRAAVQESHEVRQHMFQWISAFENGVTVDNALMVSVPARDKDGEVVGYLLTTYSFGATGTPVGTTEFQPLRDVATVDEGGGDEHE